MVFKLFGRNTHHALFIVLAIFNTNFSSSKYSNYTFLHTGMFKFSGFWSNFHSRTRFLMLKILKTEIQRLSIECSKVQPELTQVKDYV